MSRLANANAYARVIRALKRVGFQEHHGGKHTIMEHPDGRYTVIPRHPRINPFTLKTILKQCRITEENYLTLY